MSTVEVMLQKAQAEVHLRTDRESVPASVSDPRCDCSDLPAHLAGTVFPEG